MKLKNLYTLTGTVLHGAYKVVTNDDDNQLLFLPIQEAFHPNTLMSRM